MAHQKFLYSNVSHIKHFSRSFSLAKTNLGIFSKYTQFYEACIKYPKLTNAQSNVKKSEELLNSKKALTDLCWSNLQLNQEKLREIDYKLDPLSTVDSRYPPLLQDEVLIQQRLKFLSQDFYTYHQEEIDESHSLGSALRNNIIGYHETEKRMQRFLFASIAVGLLLGYLYAIYWGEFYRYLTGSGSLHTNEDLKALIKKIVDMIRSNNLFLYKQIEDLRLLTHFQDDAFICPPIEEISFDSLNNDDLFLSQIAEVVLSINKKDQITQDDFITIEKGLLRRREFNKLPVLEVTADSSDLSGKDKVLWLTICAYISAAIIVPVALVAMA